MFRAVSLAAAIAGFALAVLGSWIRINGAGLTCPDWPLCNGKIIPPLDGLVLLEWSHRMIAFCEGFLVLGALAGAWQARGRIAYLSLVSAFIAVVFALQIGLGGATVLLANNPPSVVWHWAVAMLFLAGLTSLAAIAWIEPARHRSEPAHSNLYPILGACVVSAFAAMCAGAYVSSSGAGLACSTFPSCDGTWFGSDPAQLAQMLHRSCAGLLLVFATVAGYWGIVAGRGRVRTATLTGLALIVVQILLGIGNVVWALPVVLREAHAANAALTFLTFVVAFVFATLEGTLSESRSQPLMRTASSAAPTTVSSRL